VQGGCSLQTYAHNFSLKGCNGSLVSARCSTAVHAQLTSMEATSPLVLLQLLLLAIPT
jgi:hypothetical protein